MRPSSYEGVSFQIAVKLRSCGGENEMVLLTLESCSGVHFILFILRDEAFEEGECEVSQL
jgi:hypothetical protein